MAIPFDVFQAALVVGTEAKKAIDRGLAEERTAELWYGGCKDVFSKKRFWRSRRLSKIFVVPADRREAVVKRLIDQSALWFNQPQLKGRASWLILYGSLIEINQLQPHLTMDVTEEGFRPAFLDHQPTASVDFWSMAALTYALNGGINLLDGGISTYENSQGHQVLALGTPRYNLLATRKSVTEPWRGGIGTQVADAPIPCNIRTGWDNLTRHGHTMWDRPTARRQELLVEPAFSQTQMRWTEMNAEGVSWSTQDFHDELVQHWLAALAEQLRISKEKGEPTGSANTIARWQQWRDAATDLQRRVSTLFQRIGRIQDYELENAASTLYEKQDLNTNNWNLYNPQRQEVTEPMDQLRRLTPFYLRCVNNCFVIGSQYMRFQDDATLLLG